METRKRKPLSDITSSHNLIPISTLRKLVASLSNSGAVSEPSVSILKPHSTNQKLCSDSRPGTSIGSSDNVSAVRNSKAVQFRTPQRANPEITLPGRSLRSKDAAYNRKEVIEKSNRSREADAVTVGPALLEKRKDKGKIIDTPSKILNIENEICNSFGCSFVKTKDEKEAILKPSDDSIAKTKGIRKEILSPSSFLVERTKEKGKAVFSRPDIVEINKHDGSSTALTVNCPRPRRKSEKKNNDVGSSCPPMMRTKNIRNDLDEAGDIKSSKSWTDPHPKCRKKRCSRNQSTSELPPEFIEQQRAYFKEIDEFELPEEEISHDELD